MTGVVTVAVGNQPAWLRKYDTDGNVDWTSTYGSPQGAVARGDGLAIDSNGDLTINGGTLDITAQSPFDFDGTGTLTGGTITVNGQQVTELTNQMMGGPMGGGPGGDPGAGRRGGR